MSGSFANQAGAGLFTMFTSKKYHFLLTSVTYLPDRSAKWLSLRGFAEIEYPGAFTLKDAGKT